MRRFITVGYIYIGNSKILLVKSFKHNAFYVPGGKLEKDEDEISAIIREVKEEINVDLDRQSISHYKNFTDQAHDEPTGTQVTIICYTAQHQGNPQPSNEIEKMQYFSHQEYHNLPELASAVTLIVDNLKEKGLIE